VGTGDHRTQVGIVGAGPAGLLLGRVLELAGIESVILEARSREYVEGRVRAGMLEHRTAGFLDEIGLGERLRREAFVHTGFELRFARGRHRIPVADLTGGCTTVMYAQQEIVRDAIAARTDSGLPLLFDVSEVRLEDLLTSEPAINYTHDGRRHALRCDVIAGCDGYHGCCRPAIPQDRLRTYTHQYPFAWLGILADAPPSTVELIYAAHERGFALHSLRSSQVSRFYLQVGAAERAEDWSDDRVWHELRARLGVDDAWTLTDGPITKKNITAMRSVVTEPMQYGRLFLAGDAAHIVPPTAAKGLNLAVADVCLLGDAVVTWYESGDRSLLDHYSELALKRVWRAQEFSRSMTWLLHHDPGSNFEARLQRAQLENIVTSQAAMAAFSENYVGAPFVGRVHHDVGRAPRVPRMAPP
jgi:p-hydroxybenzoate 3-monooxygenase